MPVDFMHANHLAPQGSTQFGGFSPQHRNNAILRFELNDPSITDVLVLSIDDFPIPYGVSSILELHYLNQVRKVAGKTTYADMTVNYNDFVDTATANGLWAWRKRVEDPITGFKGLPADYKRDGYAELLAPNGDANLSRYVYIQGAFPSSDPNHGQYGQSSDETAKIEMTFAIDLAYPWIGLDTPISV